MKRKFKICLLVALVLSLFGPTRVMAADESARQCQVEVSSSLFTALQHVLLDRCEHEQIVTQLAAHEHLFGLSGRIRTDVIPRPERGAMA